MEFLKHIDRLNNQLAFTVEKEQSGYLPFLDILVNYEHPSSRLQTSVFEKLRTLVTCSAIMQGMQQVLKLWW